VLKYTNYSTDIKAINNFDRYIELADGLETDYIRLLYYEFDHYYKENYKSYEYYKLCTILKGRKHIKLNNQENFIHGKEEFTVLSPQLTLSIETLEPTKCLVVEISDILLEKIRDKAYRREELDCIPMDGKNCALFRESSELIKSDMEKITSTALGDSRDKEFLIDLYAQEMIYKLLNRMNTNIILVEKNNNSIRKAIELMKAGYRSNLDLSEIAHSVSMSPALFSIKFKKITGFSPYVYYTNIKLNEAKKMLRYNSVTEVAYDLGYYNISYFIKLFYDKFGTTPKQFQLKFYNNSI
jgi:AraC-like DNA-binding protein